MKGCTNYYAKDELAILLGVVIMGAGRTAFTKIYFQVGYTDPFFATALVFIGQAFALPTYFLYQMTQRIISSSLGRADVKENAGDTAENITMYTTEHGLANDGQTQEFTSSDFDSSEGTQQQDDEVPDLATMPSRSNVINTKTPYGDDLSVDAGRAQKMQSMKQKFGSSTGLNDASTQAVQWVQRIPFWARPLITSAFGICAALFRVSAVLFLPASIADILMTGLELFFIIIAQKVIRRRQILPQRWVGAFVVLVGLVVVTCAEFSSDESMHVESLGLGLLCVVCRVVSGVGLDMSQELFTQESDTSPILLLGMESLYELVLFIALYFAASPITGLHPSDALAQAVSSPQAIYLTIGLLATFFAAGMFNIMGTAVTSSMTRNLWITSFRGATVWIIALTTYYASTNNGNNLTDIILGEPWMVPGSFIILAGLIVIFVGVRIYYHTGPIQLLCGRCSILLEGPMETRDESETEEDLAWELEQSRDDSRDIWV